MDLVSMAAALTAAQNIPIIGPFVHAYGLWILIAWALDVFVVAPAIPAPGPASGAVWVALYRLVNVPAGNYGQARNASDPKA